MSTPPAPGPGRPETTVSLLFNGVRIRLRSLPTFILIVVGFCVAVTGPIYASLTADQGHEETVRITAITGTYPQASGYRVTGKSYTVWGVLKDGSVVGQVVNDLELNRGSFHVWTRHDPGKAPEVGSSLLSPEIHHLAAAHRLMLAGAIMFVLGVISGVINVMITRRRKAGAMAADGS